MGLMRLNLLDCCHQLMLSHLECHLNCCIVAERLMGSCLWSSLGSRCRSLEPNSAASLANLSTASLPSDPMCAAIHVKVIGRVGFAWCSRIRMRSRSLWRLVMFRLILLMRYCAGFGRLICRVLIVAWLSMLVLSEPCLFCMVHAR